MSKEKTICCKECSAGAYPCRNSECACHQLQQQNHLKEKTCNCKEISCQKDCTRNHTHKGFFCEICEPETYKKVFVDNDLTIENRNKEKEKTKESWTDEMKDKLLRFSRYVWQLSPHNFEDGNATKFKASLEDWVDLEIAPFIKTLLSTERARLTEALEGMEASYDIRDYDLKSVHDGYFRAINQAISLINQEE